jgi:IS30 family transposase
MTEGKKLTKLSLTLQERREIERLLKEGLSISRTARTINRSSSGVSAEVLINGGRKLYNAEKAQKNHIHRISVPRGKNQWKAIGADQKKEIIQLLDMGNSIKQINLKTKIPCSMILLIKHEQRNNMEDAQSFEDRIGALEAQMEILIEQLRKR